MLAVALAGAGSCGDGAPATAREYYGQIAAASCSRLRECDLRVAEPCEELWVADQACGDGRSPALPACDEVVDADDDALRRCVSAIGEQPCDEAEGGYFPDGCDFGEIFPER